MGVRPDWSRIKEGYYTTEMIYHMGMKNNDIASFYVPWGYSVYVYDGD